MVLIIYLFEARCKPCKSETLRHRIACPAVGDMQETSDGKRTTKEGNRKQSEAKQEEQMKETMIFHVGRGVDPRKSKLLR